MNEFKFHTNTIACRTHWANLVLRIIASEFSVIIIISRHILVVSLSKSSVSPCTLEQKKLRVCSFWQETKINYERERPLRKRKLSKLVVRGRSDALTTIMNCYHIMPRCHVTTFSGLCIIQIRDRTTKRNRVDDKNRFINLFDFLMA